MQTTADTEAPSKPTAPKTPEVASADGQGDRHGKVRVAVVKVIAAPIGKSITGEPLRPRP